MKKLWRDVFIIGVLLTLVSAGSTLNASTSLDNCNEVKQIRINCGSINGP